MKLFGNNSMNSEPTLIPGIILSDMVIREQGTNKASCIGVFHAFTLPQFPHNIGGFFATIGITNIREQLEEMNATARLEEPGSGHVLASSSAKLQFHGGGSGLTPQMVIDLSFPFKAVTLSHAGTYHLVILVNNEEVGRRPLEVISITSARNPQ